MFSVYYPDGRLDGRTEDDWLSMPDDGVQIVVRWEPTDYRGWEGISGDREVWTGVDVYDPFDWGPKTGTLLSDDDYLAIWEQMKADGDPGP